MAINDVDKYVATLQKYNTNIKDEEVKAAVEKIIAEKVPENDTPEVKKFLLGSVELTSLRTTDNEENILAMVEKVNRFDKEYPELPHVATICTYPNFAKLVSESLEVDGVQVVNVSGSFPSSQTFIEVKVAEASLAVKDGATEIDIVMPVGKYLSGDYEGVADEIGEQKQACGECPMKVILETGCLPSMSDVKKASIIAMYAGADYIKTSTGKEKVSATPEAAYVMCQAIKEYYDQTGIQIGLKPAGGINTVRDAVTYYAIVKEVLGEKWLTNKWFRMGTSRLTNLLISELLGKEVKFFSEPPNPLKGALPSCKQVEWQSPSQGAVFFRGFNGYIVQNIKSFEKALQLKALPSFGFFKIFTSSALSAPSISSPGPNDHPKRPHPEAHSAQTTTSKRPFRKSSRAKSSPISGWKSPL